MKQRRPLKLLHQLTQISGGNIINVSPYTIIFPLIKLILGDCVCGDKTSKQLYNIHYEQLVQWVTTNHPKQSTKKNPTRKRQTAKKDVEKFIETNFIDPTDDSFLQSFQWKSTRMIAIKTYGNVCQCCGSTPKDGIRINVDHIKPRKFFPDLALDINNLQILCEECNHGKGNWDTTDWR